MLRLALSAAILIAAGGAEAASLRVTPITIERVAPAAAGSLILSDPGTEPMNVQVRIFRWTQGPAGDTLAPTRDVVVSPPIAKLKPRTDYTVRVVRIAKKPVVGEEAYRILVDELPGEAAATSGGATVRLLLRYSIPVFFLAKPAVLPKIEWAVTRQGGNFMVRAANRGSNRIRISELALRSGGRSTTLAGGLAGYVLAGSTMTWTWAAPAGAPQAGPATLTFDSDGGRMDVPVVVKPGD